MPVQSRCPSCSAAIPSGAAWCSLCHADLRVRREPVSVSHGRSESVLPSADVAATPEAAPAAPRPSGRHSKDGVEVTGRREVAGRREPTGRREAGRRTSTPIPPEVALAGIELPAPGTSKDEVEAVADQMLQRLALTEPRTRLLDPDDLPGGKWGFAAATGGVLIILMLSIFTIFGAVLNR